VNTDPNPVGTATHPDADTWVLRLPWPKPPITLNTHWRAWQARWRAEQTIAATSALLAAHARIPACQRIHVQLVWVPRLNRTRDEDNPIATLKPLIDGLKKAGVVPDDNPKHVTWDRPRIEPANPRDPHMDLIVTRLAPKDRP
jgi:hypothetical protein